MFQLLSKISAAWQWTVCRRVGLFATDIQVENPLSAFSENRSPPTPPNVVPHDIWIKFLVRRFEVIKYYSRDQVGVWRPEMRMDQSELARQLFYAIIESLAK